MVNTPTISKGDYGIAITTYLKDAKGQAIAIQDDTVNAYIIYPDNTEHQVNIENIIISDNTNGIVLIILTADDTADLANHSIYVELKGTDYCISADAAATYYVTERHGGALSV